MKNVLKLSNYLFDWYWKKWGKTITIVSLCAGVGLLAFICFLGGNNDSVEYYSSAFRSYDMAIDNSFLPLVFVLGLLLVLIMQFVQIRGFSTNGKGIYNMFMLPMKRKEVYLAFLLSVSAAAAIYYLLWLILLVAAYFPISALHESAAAKEVIYYSEVVTLTGLDTHIENGLFLAFRRSTFLSMFFPVTLWHVLPFLGGLLLVITGLMYGCFRTKDIGTCVVVSGLSVLCGIYLFVGATLHRFDLPFAIGTSSELFLGRGEVLGLVGIAVSVLLHLNIISHLEYELKL